VKAITDNNVVNFRWTLDGKALDLPTNTSKYTIETDKLSIGSHNLGIAVKDNSSTTVCPGYADLRITIVDLPKTELQEEAAICEGENLILDAGPDASRYLWNTGDTTRTIIVNSAGTYNVEADGGYGTRCLAFDTIEVSVIPMPKKVELGKDTCILSDNPNIALDAGSNAGFIYKWSTGEATQKITVTKSGEYIVTVSSAISSKCYRSDSVIINFLRQKYLGRDTCIATDNPLYKLDAGNNPNFKYLWSTGEQMQGINIRQSGKYFLTVTSASGSYCSKTDSITVNILKKNYLGTDQTLCTGTPLTLYAPEAPAGYKYKYTWKPSGDTATTLYFENKAPADIKIYLEVYGGCNDSIRIKVIACDIEIPDILIPESAENNLFRIKNIENFPDTRLTIFNRWGGKVFENAHYEEQENAWDGGDNPPGVYFYILHVSGKEYRKGTITLIR
jgi:hypothetical protein